MSKKNSQHSVILNVDILPLILAYLSDDVKNQYDIRDQYEIYNCLFIHSTWTKIFTKILWRSPIWKSPRSYKKFLDTLRKENTLYNYSQMIRHLTFAPYRNRPQPSFSLPDIHLLSQKCSNITNLTFGHREGDMIPPEGVLILLKKNPNIISIKFLTLHFDEKWLNKALIPLINGHCSKLEELIFYEPQQNQNIQQPTDLSFNFLYSIGRKCKSINTLEIRPRISNTNALMIIKFFPNLTSLSVKTIEPEALKTLLQGFPNLESFSFSFPKSISKEMTIEIAKEFPPLENFSISLDLDTSSTFISTFVTTQSKLKKLELFKCSNLFDSDLSLLSEFCNQLESINLSFCNNLSDVSITSLTQKNRQLKKIHLTNIPKLTNKGILSLVNNCPNLISFIFNIQQNHESEGLEGGGDGGDSDGDGSVGGNNQRRNSIQNQITSLAFIHLLQNCKKLMEFSGHFSDNTASKILFELSKKRHYGRGSYYKNLETLKILPNGRSCLFKTQLELNPAQNSETELLGNLAENCKNLRVLVLKCNFSKLNRNSFVKSVLKFKNLEELSVKLKPNQSLSDSHLRRLLSHPKLREVELGDALTKDAKLFIKKYNNNSRGGPYFY
ncbi:hypothetical protein RclHR1_00400032 [Rhizophagus clarus]|uniref:Cyclin-like F-box n=1 Tax=Rhizophagus clarus TaxID=94130 RepID=A0A2Z6RE73_9GLOM|nr:hypothetical protein RclHR1_00400032 [Rhizophagus clarus]GES87243.1 cyclin-like F-box [Rhizophagus clarus]